MNWRPFAEMNNNIKIRKYNNILRHLTRQMDRGIESEKEKDRHLDRQTAWDGLLITVANRLSADNSGGGGCCGVCCLQYCTCLTFYDFAHYFCCGSAGKTSQSPDDHFNDARPRALGK